MAGPFDYPQAQMYAMAVKAPSKLPPSPYPGKVLPPGGGKTLPPIYGSPKPRPVGVPGGVGIGGQGGEWVDAGYGAGGPLNSQGMEWRPGAVNPAPEFGGGPAVQPPNPAPGFEGGPTRVGGGAMPPVPYGGDPRYWMRRRS